MVVKRFKIFVLFGLRILSLKVYLRELKILEEKVLFI